MDVPGTAVLLYSRQPFGSLWLVYHVGLEAAAQTRSRALANPWRMLTNASRLTESAWHAHERAAPLLGPALSCERRPRGGPPLLFRRRCKALNFFRTYSFGYMHHHSAIFYLWAAWFAFSFVPFVSLARSLSFLSFFLSSSLRRASALRRARLPARA